ncbi:hypothetical protein JW964_23895, partial [candidate division KSB1 bacterium]|nr:hypothetical protein [candidate division KSB1 bacterium]
MQRLWTWFLIGLLCNGYFLFGQTSINVKLPTKVEVTKGDTVRIPITVDDLSGKNVFNMNGKILFRSQTLDFIGAESKGFLIEKWGAPTINTTKDGEAIFAGFGAEALSGSGDLIQLLFLANGDYGDTTSLIFDIFQFTNESNLQPKLNRGFVKIHPKPVQVTVTTSIGAPTVVIVDGVKRNAPYTAIWQPGTKHTLNIDDVQQGGTGVQYHFQNWSDGGAQSHEVSPKNDITYRANLITKFFVKVNSQMGTPKGEGWYNANSSVKISVDTLIAVNSNKRYHFTKWVGTGAGAYSGSQAEVSFQVTGPVTETASWIAQYYLSVKTLPENMAQISGTGWYNFSTHAKTGTASNSAQGRNFKGWMVDKKEVTGNPISILMDTSHVAIADYSLDVSVIVTTNMPDSTDVIVDGQTHKAPVKLTWSVGSEHTIAVPASQKEENGSRLHFVSWSDGGNREHTVTIQQNTTFTAKLNKQYFLSVATQPNLGITIDGSGWYDAKKLVTTGVAPATHQTDQKNYVFVNWSVDGEIKAGNPLVITLNSPKNAIAKYLQNYYITGQIKVDNTPVKGIKVRLSGSSKDSVVTDQYGEFVFQGLFPGDYKMEPISRSYSFNPAAYTYKFFRMSKSNQDFTAKDIEPPRVTLLYPNGGEKIQANSVDSIRWKATDNLGIDSVYLYYSRDGGANWEKLPTFIIRPSVSLWKAPHKNYLKGKIRIEAKDLSGNIGQDESDKIFEIIGGATIEEFTSKQIKKYSLSQNFPNPFNPSTTISYQLPDEGRVILAIFNLSGQMIKKLVNENQAPGNYGIKWDATDEKGLSI